MAAVGQACRKPRPTPYGAKVIRSRPLVSLVSVSARNGYYLCGTVERVAKGETLEIASVHAILTHAAENMLG